MYMISFIKKWFFKLVNFLFGKSKIFIIILGWFLVITGAIFLLNPQKARNKLLGHGLGFLKGPLLFITIYLVMLLISLGWNTQATVLKILSLLGAIIIVKLYFSLKKKTYQKLAEKFALIPMPVLKSFAYIQIVVGGLMLILQRRIW